MVRTLTAKVAMGIAPLILTGWLATLGAGAGIVLMLTGEPEAGVGLLTAAVVTPLSYLIGRAQGFTIGQIGGSKAPK